MITKAVRLLHRWLAHDVPDGSDDPPDPTLDDETNDLLIAYPMSRAEADQAVLEAMGRIPSEALEQSILVGDGDPNVEAAVATCKAELARRRMLAEFNEARQRLTAAAPEVQARARETLRRLESLR